MIWKEIKGFEGLYSVSDMGHIRNDRTYRVLRTSVNTNYLRLVLVKDGLRFSKSVHRIVAETFIPNPDNKPCVLHDDDDTMNNFVENLRWGTQQENIRERVSKNRSAKGDNHGHMKITISEIEELVQLKTMYGLPTQKIIAKEYGVCQRTIWKHLDRNLPKSLRNSQS